MSGQGDRSVFATAALPSGASPLTTALLLSVFPTVSDAQDHQQVHHHSGRRPPRVDQSATEHESAGEADPGPSILSTDLVPLQPGGHLIGPARPPYSSAIDPEQSRTAQAPIIGVLQDTATLVSTPGAVERAVGAAGPLLRAPNRQLPLLPLSRFEKDFTPIRVIGRGMFSKVYVARHNKTGILRAVKAVDVRRLRSTASSQKSRRKSGSKTKGVPVALAREVALLARLRHPHIVRLFSAYAGSGAPTSPSAPYSEAQPRQTANGRAANLRQATDKVESKSRGSASAEESPAFGFAPNVEDLLLVDGQIDSRKPPPSASDSALAQTAQPVTMETGSGVGLYATAGRESSSGSDFTNDQDAAAIVSARGGLPSGPRSTVPLVKHGTAFDPDSLTLDLSDTGGSNRDHAHLFGQDQAGRDAVEEIGASYGVDDAGTEAMALVPHAQRGPTHSSSAAIVLASPTMLMPAGAAIGSADAQAQTSMSRRLRRAMAPPVTEEAPDPDGDDAIASRKSSSKSVSSTVGRKRSKKAITSSSSGSSVVSRSGQSAKLPTLRIRTETGDDVLKVGNDTVLLVTELARGGELFDRLVEAGNFAEHVVRHVMWQLLSALAHLHARGLVHRDVKPENILVLDPPPSTDTDDATRADEAAAATQDEQEDEDDDGIDADDPTASSHRRASVGAKQHHRSSLSHQQQDLTQQDTDDVSWLLHSRGISSDSQSSRQSDGLDDDPTAPPPSLSPLRTGPQGELLPTIKLADFGIARHVGRGPLAMAKTFCGSPQYVAPEVIRARDAAAAATRRRHRQEEPGDSSESSPSTPENLPGYGCEVDVWSAGVVMFALLAGELPFDDSDYDAVAGSAEESWVQRILHGSFRFDPPIWTHVSSFARDLITRMLQVNPLKRPSAVECLRHPWFLPMHAAYAARRHGADDDEATAAAATAAMAAAMPTARSLAQSAVIGPAAAASIPPSALVGHPHPFGRPGVPTFGLPAVSAGRIGMAGVEQDVLRAALSWASSWLGDNIAMAEIAGTNMSAQSLPTAATLGLPAPTPPTPPAGTSSSSSSSSSRSLPASGKTLPASLRQSKNQAKQPFVIGHQAGTMHPFDMPTPTPAAATAAAAAAASTGARAGHRRAIGSARLPGSKSNSRSSSTTQPASAAAALPPSHTQEETAQRSAASSASKQSSGEAKQSGTIGIQDLDVIAPLGRLAAAAAESRTQVRVWRRSSLQAFGAFASVLHTVAGAADGVVHRCLSSASRCAALTASISTAMFDAQLALKDGDSTSTELLLAESRRWVETVVAEASMAADAADVLRSRVSEAAEQTTSASVSASLMDQHHRRREILDASIMLPGTPYGASGVGVGMAPAWTNHHGSDHGSVSAPHSEASADRSAASVSDLEELTCSMKKWIMASPRDSEADDSDQMDKLSGLGPAAGASSLLQQPIASPKHAVSGASSSQSTKQVFTPLASSPAPQGQYAASAGSSTRDQDSPLIAPLLARAMNLDALESLTTLPPPSPHLVRTQSADDQHMPATADEGLGQLTQAQPSNKPKVSPIRRVSIDGHQSATTVSSRAALSSRRSQSITGPPQPTLPTSSSGAVTHTASAKLDTDRHMPSSSQLHRPIRSGHHGLGPHDLSITAAPRTTRAAAGASPDDDNHDADDFVPLHIGPPSPTPGSSNQQFHRDQHDAAVSLSGSALTPGASDSSTVAISSGLSVLHAALSRLGEALRTVADKWRAAARLCEGTLPAVDRLSLLARASSAKLVLRASDQLAKASLFWRSAQAILEAGQRFQAELEHVNDEIDELSVGDSEHDHRDLASIRMPKARDTGSVKSFTATKDDTDGVETRADHDQAASALSQDLSERLGLD